jgi:phosphoadenosine phosphosulfate reductase
MTASPRLPVHLTDPWDVLAWALETYGDGLTVVTSLGPQTLVAIDILHRLGGAVEIVLIDTGLLFAQTHQLRRRLQDLYQRDIKTIRPQATLAEQAKAHGPALWSRLPDRCCQLRKVEPLRRALRGKDAWITGLRRDQSASRAQTETFAWDSVHHMVKVSPLAWWTRDRVFTYLLDHKVPYNPLLDDGFTSVGCWPCTHPAQGSDERAGRWRGFNKTECGLHVAPNPTIHGEHKP